MIAPPRPVLALLALAALACGADYTEATKALGNLKPGSSIPASKVTVTVPSGTLIGGDNVSSTLIDWKKGIKSGARSMGFPGSVHKTGAGAHNGYFSGTWTTGGSKGGSVLTWDMASTGVMGCKFSITKTLILSIGASGLLPIALDPVNKTVHTAGSHVFAIVKGEGLSTKDSTCDCTKQGSPWLVPIEAGASAKPGEYETTIDGKSYGRKVVVSDCEFELSATTEKQGKKELYFRFPKTSATVVATLKKKGKHCPGSHELILSGGGDPLSASVACPGKSGGKASQKFETFPMAAATYDARINTATKSGIFTIAPRQTLPMALRAASGELGYVIVKHTPTGSWVPGQLANVRFYLDSGITNHVAAGGSKAWAPAEQAKAPGDEIKKWQDLVDHVQKHEEGHVTTQNNLGTQQIQTHAGWTTTDLEVAATALETTAHENWHTQYEGNAAGIVNTAPFNIPDRE